MDKWIKENKITAIIIIILVVVLGWFIFYKQGNSPKQSLNTTQINDINLQSKCAIQAQKTLDNFSKQYTNDGWDPSVGEPAPTRANFTQSNHFNKKLNKCFVLIKYDFTYAATLNTRFSDNGETFFDAFQNDELANCSHSHDLNYLGTGNPKEFTDHCYMGDYVSTTLQNYNAFVDEKMEL